MEWWLVISLLFGGMVFLLLTNLPIAFAFLVVNMVAAYFFLGGIPGLVGVVTGTFTSITTFTLLPVPFFILMGELIFHSGLGLNAVNVLDKWLGNLRGRLSLLAIIMGVIIGALSGSTIATCALLGTILLPQMLEKRLQQEHESRSTHGSRYGGCAYSSQCTDSGTRKPCQYRCRATSYGRHTSGHDDVCPLLHLRRIMVRIKPEEAPMYDVPHSPS